MMNTFKYRGISGFTNPIPINGENSDKNIVRF